MIMDRETFIDHIREALESLENELAFEGPYADLITEEGDKVVIPFNDGSKIRLTIEVVD